MAPAAGTISDVRKRPSIDAMGPVRVATLGIATYLIIFILAPVTVITQQSLAPYLYIAFSYFAFFCGCILAQGPRDLSVTPGAPGDFLSDQQLLRIHRIVIIAAIIGAALKLVDTFIVRGVSFSSTALERASDLDSVGPNPVSIVCAVVMPACLLAPFTYQLLKQRGLAKRAQRLITHVVFLIPVLTSVLVAGRRAMTFMYLVMYFMYLTYLNKLRITARHIALVVAAGIGMLALSTAIFNNRLKAMDMTPLDSVYSSGYAFTVQPQEWIGQVMQHSPGPVGDVAFAVLASCQYYLHGIFEFVYQYQNAPPLHIWGAASFNAYYKFLAFFLGWESPAELWSDVTVRMGVFTSFFGPVFSDFGWFGAFYMLALGALAQRMWLRCKKGDFGAVPFYMYLVFTIFQFPVGNTIVGGQGLYNLSAFALFFWLMPHRRKSIRAVYRYGAPLGFYQRKTLQGGVGLER